MPKQRPPAQATKTELIRRALSRKSGSSLADLGSTTGWQAHSIRAALSRFRKAGYVIERSDAKKSSGSPVYKIISAPEAS
jgi:DNA-binding transcriptional regulator PaaX